MCRWADSDDFFVLRRFGEIGVRLLLRMQDSIAKLENSLRQEDKTWLQSGKDNGTFRHEENDDRQ